MNGRRRQAAAGLTALAGRSVGNVAEGGLNEAGEYRGGESVIFYR